MKVLAMCLALLLLSGCALVPDEYRVVTAHAGATVRAVDSDAATVRNYDELKQAILNLVKLGQTEGTIRTANYEGDVEQDLANAAYEVVKTEPLGAYAVDYMTHDSTLIVNYYEIHLTITFRRTAREIASIEPLATSTLVCSRVEQAVAELEHRVVMQVTGYRELDYQAMVEEYCRENPATALEIPQVSVSVYPDSGSVRIVELNLAYTLTPEELTSRVTEVTESIHNAAEYIRYRQTDREKLELLFTYLTERFTYTPGETATPLYDALCAGVADDVGLAQALTLICQEAGVDCYTVEGLYNGEARMWNVVSCDGGYRHVDLMYSILEGGSLRLYTDPEMTAYYWNQDQAPACILVQETAEEPTGEEDPAEQETPEPEVPEEPVSPGEEPAPEEEAPGEPTGTD